DFRAAHSRHSRNSRLHSVFVFLSRFLCSILRSIMETKIGRREFVKLAGAAGAALAGGGLEQTLAFQQTAGPDAAEKELVLLALDAVRSAGAAYADVRITRGNFEFVGARERQITAVNKR